MIRCGILHLSCDPSERERDCTYNDFEEGLVDSVYGILGNGCWLVDDGKMFAKIIYKRKRHLSMLTLLGHKKLSNI